MKNTFKGIIETESGRQITFVLSEENDNYLEAFFDVITVMGKIDNCIEFKEVREDAQN